MVRTTRATPNAAPNWMTNLADRIERTNMDKGKYWVARYFGVAQKQVEMIRPDFYKVNSILVYVQDANSTGATVYYHSHRREGHLEGHRLFIYGGELKDERIIGKKKLQPAQAAFEKEDLM